MAKQLFVVTHGRERGKRGYIDATDGVRVRLQLTGTPADRFISVKVADVEPAGFDPALTGVWEDEVL